MVCVGTYVPTHTIFREFLAWPEQIPLLVHKPGQIRDPQEEIKQNRRRKG